MKYVVEVFYQGDPILQRELTQPMFVPAEGEQLLIQFSNEFYEDQYGPSWIVRKRKMLLMKEVNTLQLFCEPYTDDDV